MNLKYLKLDYVPKGQLKGFPLVIIDRMIHEQVLQGNKPDVSVFEEDVASVKTDGGFDWDCTEDAHIFWRKVIDQMNFELFYEKYPELKFPRLVEVRVNENVDWIRRVCITIRNGRALCWDNAETIAESADSDSIITWNHYREIQEPKYKPFDFSDGLDKYDWLLGKQIRTKGKTKLTTIISIDFINVRNTSLINGLNTKMIFEDYEFTDGSPIGTKV